jgi:hypothetical protein
MDVERFGIIKIFYNCVCADFVLHATQKLAISAFIWHLTNYQNYFSPQEIRGVHCGNVVAKMFYFIIV